MDANDSAFHSGATPKITVGMKLDAMIDRINTIPSMELYWLIVAVTVIVCSFSFRPRKPIAKLPHLKEMLAMSGLRRSVRLLSSSNHPDRFWVLFRWVNYVMTAAFCFMVVNFSLHDWQHSPFPVSSLLAWSVFQCYFLGFFGVSFVHEINENDKEPREAADDKKNAVSVQNTRDCSDSRTFACRDLPTIRHATNSAQFDVVTLPDAEVAKLVLTRRLRDHDLEKLLKDNHRAVEIRRLVFQAKLASLGIPEALEGLPAEPSLDYNRVHGANCEIVVGYVPLPVGLVGPLAVNGELCYVPMATTEGCLVASTNRGAKAITAGGGAYAEILRDGITRAPCLRCESARKAAELKRWCEQPEHFAILKAVFESTTSFGKLQSCVPTVAGRNVYLRLQCFSGDAMGMNMVSKGSLAVVERLQEEFGNQGIQLVALSGNMCTDKKAAATNWIEGRGKSVVVEATIPAKVVQSTLKTTVNAMVETNLHKNLIGSAMAGVIGGFNAHASNTVTAVFLATGQDPAQNVESSNCITLLEETENGDLWISCTMPSLEVGTVGGGTCLQAQSACLDVIGCRGGSRSRPGHKAQKLAQVVAAATMAGELSLLAALSANTLVQAHMQHNRKKTS